MRSVLRITALATVIVAVGLLNPAEAKPKHKHGDGQRVHMAQASGQPGQQIDQQHRGPGNPLGGASMMPSGMPPGGGGQAAAQGHPGQQQMQQRRGPEHPHSGASMMQPGMQPGMGSQATSQGGPGGEQPPGWSRGAKRGWQGRNMPPGQYKKYHH
jgi:hypothetical protein